MDPTTQELIDSGDLDELVRHVDRLCETRAWDDLEDLRHRCRAALDRGRQLWPISSLAEYRLALRAPAPWAAGVLTGDTGVWALGPLAEVAASTHTFAELAPHLPMGPAASVTAHERVVRGEDLTAHQHDAWRHLIHDDGLPLCLQPWEPAYPVATYRDSTAEFPAPDPPPSSSYVPVQPGSPTTPDNPATPDSPATQGRAAAGATKGSAGTSSAETGSAREASTGKASPSEASTSPGGELAHDAATAALRELTAGWSTGWEAGSPARVAVVDGGPAHAIAAVCPDADTMAPITADQAMAVMAWAAASGGATGRRRGMARGRFDAWWTVAALGGCDDDWPLDPNEVGDIATSLDWWVFGHRSVATGWSLRLAVADPVDGLAWAIDAADVASTLSASPTP